MKTRRAGHRGVLTKLLKKVEPSSEELLQEYDVSELSTIRGLIAKKQETIDQLNEKIVEELSEEEVSEEIEEADRYTYDIEMAVTKLSKIIKESEITDKQSSKSLLNPNAHEFINYTNHQESQPQPSFMHANTSASVFSNSSMYHKLPKLNLPTFGGNMLEWQPFWDSFSAAVHDNLSLSDVQKFNYLKSQLFGEATQCIAGLQITNTNYGQALHVLKQRFGQPHKIVQTYMQSLISLPSPTSNITHLKFFYDSMENYIRGLESIGESQESFGSLLVPIILNKLPGNIRENMVRAHGGDHWNLPSLRQAIQHEITIKEAGQSVNGDNIEPNYTPTSAFLTGTNRNYANQKGKRDITKKPCIFCQGVHAPLACKNVMEIEDRKRIVKEKQACFNCLGNHRVADCKSDKTCKNCNKRHHTSICSKNETHLYTKSKDSSTSKPDTDAAVASMHSSTSSVRSQVLLKTAIAPITYDKTHFNTANILFDEGAQRSFITQEMADLLNLRPHRKEAITISGFGESNKKVRNLPIATIYIKGLTNILIPIEVLIVPQIAYPIHTYARNQSSFTHLNGLKLAHPALQDKDFEISVLVGADYYWDIVGDRVIRGSGPTAVQSKVGYLLSGPIQLNTNSNNQSTSSIMNILTPHRLEECEIHKFWEIESIGTENDSEVRKSHYMSLLMPANALMEPVPTCVKETLLLS
ncbi:uncharacterized protein [Mytilus edulis]|uniref:uncharacterized protein n=1 Tax=Mytilus edulis TaxID=6550 RepID=UPI0039EE9DAF